MLKKRRTRCIACFCSNKTVLFMGMTLDGKLVVAISSRALFDFEEENEIFEQGDDRAYMRLQLERIDTPA